MAERGTRSPLEMLDVMGIVEAEPGPGLRHLEVYCPDGLLTLLWHGPRDATDVPAGGLTQRERASCLASSRISLT